MRNIVYTIQKLVSILVVKVLAAALNNLERVLVEEQRDRRAVRVG